MGVSEPLAGASAPPASGCCLLDGLSVSAGLGGLGATKPQWSQTAPPREESVAGGHRLLGASGPSRPCTSGSSHQWVLPSGSLWSRGAGRGAPWCCQC